MVGRFSIGEFSKHTKVSIRTLHYYDEISLIKPVKDVRTGHRIYSEENIQTLHKVMTLKSLGYSLEQIKELIYRSSMDMTIIESLRMQKEKLEMDREKIDTSLSTLRRTIAILEEVGEVDSTILMSIIAGMQTEKEQRSYAEKLVDKDIVDQYYDVSEDIKLELEKASLKFYERVKQLAEKPIHHEEVHEMLHDYFSLIFKLTGKDEFQEALADVVSKIEDKDDDYLNEIADELERTFPSPLTKEEESWLEQAMLHYLKSIDIFSEGEEE
ncbi:MerR family transcriptional regulator [Oceanobacillus piezotolerans]|uniref:MerR family transcriptional regulator n=1 Tax=Oceanobacillus piezotolerans TaxID=2448030 RepID=A0A498D706_9BACI|nr:MerR family transcriptional regulator [Oceanobacillus piezotolerans]RLL41293.1 MerR family transcriptional regulator [Oceanobacillus piezotolerans]